MLFQILKNNFSIRSLSWLNFWKIFQILSRLFRQQIITLSLINLKITDRNLYFLFFQPFLIEDISQGSWDETSIIKTFSSTSHCEGFTRSCLTICEDCAVVTIDCRVDYIFGYFIEDLLLLCVHIKDLVKCK